MSLKYRIALVIFLLEAIMMSTVFTFTLHRSEKVNREQFAVTERAVVGILAELSRVALLTTEYAELQPYIEYLATDPHVKKVLVVDKLNRIVVSSAVSDIGDGLPVLTNTDAQYWYVKKIQNASGSIGSVAINFSHEHLIEANRQVLNDAISIALGGMALIAVVGVVTGTLLTRRLEVVSSAARKLADGSFEVQTGLQGRDEIGILGVAFDTMARRIRQYVLDLQAGRNELEKAHNELEIRVADRTAELASVNKKLEYLALHDPLTGLSNRTLFMSRLERAIKASSEDSTVMALMMIDLNRFKEVNDTLGHKFGDLLLIEVARRMRGALRDEDTVARLGGDEFAIVLPNIAPDSIARMGEKILLVLEPPHLIEGKMLVVGGSIGAVLFPKHGETAALLIQRADSAMYAAKRGKRGFVLYAHDIDTNAAKAPEQTMA